MRYFSMFAAVVAFSLFPCLCCGANDSNLPPEALLAICRSNVESWQCLAVDYTVAIHHTQEFYTYFERRSSQADSMLKKATGGPLEAIFNRVFGSDAKQSSKDFKSLNPDETTRIVFRWQGDRFFVSKESQEEMRLDSGSKTVAFREVSSWDGHRFRGARYVDGQMKFGFLRSDRLTFNVFAPPLVGSRESFCKRMSPLDEFLFVEPQRLESLPVRDDEKRKGVLRGFRHIEKREEKRAFGAPSVWVDVVTDVTMDMARGGAIVSIVRTLDNRYPNGKTRVVRQMEITVTDLQPVDNGRFYPTAYEMTTYTDGSSNDENADDTARVFGNAVSSGDWTGPMEKESARPVKVIPFLRQSFRASQVKMDGSLSNTDFQVCFEEGALVTDDVAGTLHWHNDIEGFFTDAVENAKMEFVKSAAGVKTVSENGKRHARNGQTTSTERPTTKSIVLPAGSTALPSATTVTIVPRVQAWVLGTLIVLGAGGGILLGRSVARRRGEKRFRNGQDAKPGGPGEAV